ncbi:protein kinase domain-containing protein [Ktedonospora formicarum]|uniref:non-specific serine/threonine protein kinase n=1 Tax=Ktedonospora formicarum TaxID=2778364 RepID=A0A8J3HWT6_9CHLR|nr:ABC transporter substrate-binding protein [Ktedonospora formicarum]GHO44691.1 hypothetical protein KSX_28540 [Ktedonospora formicarum]
MTECPNCKAPVREGVRFCSSCGQRLDAQPAPDAPTLPTSGGFSSQAHVLLPGERLQGGRYVVKEVLGEGGMGAAVLATDNRLDDKLVVIKELISDSTDSTRFQEDVRNFKREVALLAHIDHPLVPNVTDHFQEGSRYFMVQEYVEGETLEARITRLNQALKERDVLIYALEALDVLDYLSQQTPPIVHRDIKPANMIVGSKDKRAHLVDFGIARAEVALHAQKKQTSALGTPGYAPPEQYQGNADPRSDLYALAATLHHLLTNRDPRHYSPFSYMPVRTINPSLSPEIERVLVRALTNDITQRYQSASSMRQEIVDILQQRFGVSDNLGNYGLNISGHFQATPAPGTPVGGTSGPVSLSGVSAQDAPTMRSGGMPPNNSGGFSQPIQANNSNSLPPTMRVGQYGSPNMTPATLQPIQPIQPIQSGYVQGYAPLTPLPPVQPPPQKQRRGNGWIIALLLLLILVLIGGGTFFYLNGLKSTNGSQQANSKDNGVGVTKIGNESIGVSDGSYSFDTSRSDGSLKTQASENLRKGEVGSAISLWSQAHAQDSSDAETLIYLENQRVVSSPHITLVVATMLSGDDSAVGVGRDNLQGAYVAQKEYNDGSKLTGGLKIMLLIANSGSKATYVNQVIDRIKNIAKSDSTFVGVMGWPYSSRAVNAAQLLGQAHIPMLSQTATSDQLTGISPYFFRVAATNKAEAVAGVKYAEQTLKVKNVAVLLDVAESYSQSLGTDFENQWKAEGNTIVAEGRYTVGDASSITKALPAILAKNPQVIYFAGHSSDVNTLLLNLPQSNIQILGGDALYELNGYTSSSRAGFSRLRFTALAYPDEWDVLGYGKEKPPFFSAYPAAFNTGNQKPGASMAIHARPMMLFSHMTR